MEYLTAENMLLIHAAIIRETGGSHGLRDRSSLLAIAALPRQAVFGKDLYPDLFAKAAVYAWGVIMNHPFVDGNKRTGMTAAIVFLENDGHHFVAQKGHLSDYAVEIAVKHYKVPQIAEWFRQQTKKI